MALELLPSYAKIAEARLQIRNPTSRDFRSQANRRAAIPPAFRELWTCSLALAPMSRANAEAFAAFCESLDGRVTALKLTLTANLFRPSAATGATLAADAARGDDTLSIVVPAGGFAAGTLISLGTVDVSTFQLFEVLDDYAAGTQTVNIAPRVRYPRSSGLSFASSTVYGRFHLASDEQGRPLVNVSHGSVNLELIEAV